MTIKKLVDGEKLLNLIDRFTINGYDGYMALIRRTPVRDAIRHCEVSSAKLAEIKQNKRKARAWDRLKAWLNENPEKFDHPYFRQEMDKFLAGEEAHESKRFDSGTQKIQP